MFAELPSEPQPLTTSPEFSLANTNDYNESLPNALSLAPPDAYLLFMTLSRSRPRLPCPPAPLHISCLCCTTTAASRSASSTPQPKAKRTAHTQPPLPPACRPHAPRVRPHATHRPTAAAMGPWRSIVIVAISSSCAKKAGAKEAARVDR